MLDQPPPGDWVPRHRGLAALRAGDLAEYLAGRRIPAVHLVPIRGVRFVRTTPARGADVRAALGALRALGADVVALPAIDEDAGV